MALAVPWHQLKILSTIFPHSITLGLELPTTETYILSLEAIQRFWYPPGNRFTETLNADPSPAICPDYPLGFGGVQLDPLLATLCGSRVSAHAQG